MADYTIIIPALNPDNRLVQLIQALLSIGISQIVVVDDGSSVSFRSVFDLLKQLGCTVCHHFVNKGKGAAIKTGIREMMTRFPTSCGFLTCDADGQHTADDIARVLAAAAQFPDALTLDTRNFHTDGIPRRSRFGNRISSALFFLSTGSHCSDTQTGLRCVPASLVSLALQTTGSRYEYEMSFLMQAVKNGVPLHSVMISTIYEAGNKSSHFRPVRDSLRVFSTPLRFVSSSLLCSAIDLGLFTLIGIVLGGDLPGRFVWATILARLFSGLLNFVINRNWSFLSQGNVQRQAMRYLILFLSQMALSAGLVSWASSLPVYPTILKAAVDLLLFCFSYFLQRRWVFAPQNSSKGRQSS